MSVHLNILCLIFINLHYTSTEHLLKGNKHFSKSIMVSVADSKIRKTDLAQGLNKQCLFTYKNRMEHRHTITLNCGRCSHVMEFTEPEKWPPNTLDLNPVNYSM